jgi:hypothetical protein
MLNSFIGKQIVLVIEPKPSKDGKKTYDRIVNYLTAQTALAPLTAEEREEARVKKDDEVPVEQLGTVIKDRRAVEQAEINQELHPGIQEPTVEELPKF